MDSILNIVLLVVAILLIAIVLLQSGKSAGASEAISGGNSALFADKKERGPELFISRLTMTLGLLFFILSIVLTVF